MTEDQRKREELLAEKFRQLLPDEAAPSELKEEVFRTLDFLDMFGEIADLYTAKFGAAELSLLDVMTPPTESTPPAADSSSEEE